ncbi:MAG: helix-turn-helix transcriptional regulator [Fimbriiglobus sp.]|jgi:lambda repressor-like predicted transcriptional regulator|nr:helix-turn-helix transcriptional regulator [Fimbriiglobus sp.]
MTTTHAISRGLMEVLAYKTAAQIVLALEECEPDLRAVALELFEQLQGDLDPEAAQATTALLAEILFPNADPSGAIGLDLAEAEAIAFAADPSAGPILKHMDRQEATFAERLREAMEAKGVTQSELAAKIGVGQPAVSMMLQRACRPQRKTVEKIAAALGVPAAELWPS